MHKAPIVKTVAATIVIGIISVAPAFANSATRGSYSCGPDQTIRLSFNLSASSASSAEIYDNNGVRRALGVWPSGTSHYLDASIRTANHSNINATSATITFAGYNCI